MISSLLCPGVEKKKMFRCVSMTESTVTETFAEVSDSLLMAQSAACRVPRAVGRFYGGCREIFSHDMVHFQLCASGFAMPDLPPVYFADIKQEFKIKSKE